MEKIDFSKTERLSPRADSWERVCARLDASEVPEATLPRTVIPFRGFYSLIPLAASFVLIAVSVLLMALRQGDSEYVSLNAMTSTELSSWYENLGEQNSETFSTDDLDFLDESVAISYLMKEAK